MNGQVDMDADVELFHPTCHGAEVRMLISTVHPSRIVLHSFPTRRSSERV